MKISSRVSASRVTFAPTRALVALSLAIGAIAAVFLVARWPAVELAAPMLQAQSGADAPRPLVTIVSSDALPHVAGKKVTTVLVEFPPGGYSPTHHHGGSVTVYVLSGRIESQLGGGPAIVYGEGGTFFEPPGIVHVFARNMSKTAPARVLAIFVHDEGATLTTYH